jgi:hypothetical protein
MAFEHLKLSAEESFSDAQAMRNKKPEASMACIADSHYLMATYYLANDDSHWEAEARATIIADLERYETFGTTVRTFRQAQYLIMALAIGDIAIAERIAALPIDRKHWGTLDSYLTFLICGILGVKQDAKRPCGALSESEAVFVDALVALSNGAQPDLSAVEKAWMAMRKKRFALTIFEHRNLFGLAIQKLQT